MSKDQENHDVFNDDDTETTSDTSTQEEVKDDAEQEAKADGEAQSGTEASEKQGEEGAEPPAANGDNKVSGQDKMIPEHRFKAAIKDVNDRLAAAQQELATLKATPAPDRAADPDGYDRHMRIETSKRIMTATHKDYDDKIAHFQEMAKASSHLNDIVGNSEIPAKMAYDLATQDLEIRQLLAMKESPEYKAFLESQKNGGKTVDTAEQLKDTKKKVDVLSKVPNLNKTATAVGRGKETASDEDDELFKGHHSVKA